MNWEWLVFTGDTVEILGKLLVAWTAIAVHHRVKNRHKIDEVVFKEMKRETRYGILGIILMVVGYGLRTFALYIL